MLKIKRETWSKNLQNMILVRDIRLPLSAGEPQAFEKALHLARVPRAKVGHLGVAKLSVDARHGQPKLVYTVAVTLKDEGEESAYAGASPCVALHQKVDFSVQNGTQPLVHRPVVCGLGPAGLFAALLLARQGYRPIVLERGRPVEERTADVERFWATGVLDTTSNVQFGEGGAGTFSDGKLNTLVKDPSGRNKEVLKILAQAGADPAITYVNKPHVGTDVLRTVVKNIRSEIESLGGEVRFDCRLEDFETQNGHLCSIRVSARKGTSEAGRTVEEIPASALVLAIGHSARDTFAMLAEKPLDMQAKAFAVGLRIQHPQTQINLSQYGREEAGNLGAASYKLTAQTSGGRV